MKDIEPFTLHELKEALKTMRRGRAKDEAGIILEMVKDADDFLWNLIIFTMTKPIFGMLI